MPSRLLIVDDDVDSLHAIRDLLLFHLQHAEVETTRSGQEALQHLRSKTYDAVVSDIKMPGLDGLSLMAAICQEHPNLPTLLITGHGERELGVKAIKSGAYAYMQKPLDREYFVAWVQRAIQLSALTRRVEEQNQVMKRRAQELEEALQALRDSEERFRQLAEATFEAIAITEQGAILRVNSNFSKMFGYEETELTGMQAVDFHPAEARELVHRMNTVCDERPYEAVCLRKDGSTFIGEIHGKAIPYHGRQVRVTAIRDITLRKRAEQSLRESEERYRTLIESATDVIYTLSLHGEITSLNPAFEASTGWDRQQCVGRHFADLVHPEDLPLAVNSFQQALAGREVPIFELRILAKSGQYRIGEFKQKALTEGQRLVGVLGIGRDVTDLRPKA
ncbi:PAS domain S-box protein [Candidatus Nitrospira bockiana]